MLFKWYPWDVLTNLVSLSEGDDQVFSFTFHDAFIEKMVLDKFKSQRGDFRLIDGNDVSRDWIEENLLTLDLFGGSESFLIKGCENFSKEILEYLGSIEKMAFNRKVVFSFLNGGKPFQNYVKNDWVEGVQVLAPRFWEDQKYLDFLCKQKKVILSYEVQNAILKMVEPTTGNFLHLLNLIDLHFPGRSVNCSVSELQNLAAGNKLDQFELATLFGTKKVRIFYKKLVDDDWDFDSLRSLFNFMQTHIFKMMDTSYMDKKAKLSKYDKEIEMCSRAWKSEELGSSMKLFGKLEIQAKKRSPELRGYLRQLYLKQLS